MSGKRSDGCLSACRVSLSRAFLYLSVPTYAMSQSSARRFPVKCVQSAQRSQRPPTSDPMHRSRTKLAAAVAAHKLPKHSATWQRLSSRGERERERGRGVELLLSAVDVVRVAARRTRPTHRAELRVSAPIAMRSTAVICVLFRH